jgi:hypothetical protein
MGHANGEGDNHGSVGQSQGMSQTQQPLKSAQTNGGAFRMLEEKTGMTSDQLQQLYASSGAKNFGQFVSAIVVSKNLGLDTKQVLNGLRTQNLGQTLQSLGVSKDAAKDAIKKANTQRFSSPKRFRLFLRRGGGRLTGTSCALISEPLMTSGNFKPWAATQLDPGRRRQHRDPTHSQKTGE